MCWCYWTEPKEQIAKEDITCYKVVDTNKDGLIESYYKRFQYTLNVVYSLNPTPIIVQRGMDNYYIIERAYHSYRDKPTSEGNRFWVGYASYHKAPSAALVRCTIPKGAHYYVNKTAYASDTIIINEIIKF